MRLPLRGLLFVALLLLGSFSLRADESAPAPITDPSQVGDHYRQVVARPEFQESEDDDANTHFRDLLSQWFMRLGAKFGEFKYANRMPAFESMLMSLLVAFSVAGLLYIIVRLTRRRAVMELDRPSENPGPRVFRPPEFYDQEIQQAIQSKDWHTAWLAAWRQFLSRLENRELVDADRTRTNREYLAQLRARMLPASVETLLAGMVEAYDRFIYGRRPIGEPDWNHFHQQIDEAALLLHLDDKGTAARHKAGTP